MHKRLIAAWMGVKTNLVTRSPSEGLRLKKSQVFRRALGGGGHLEIGCGFPKESGNHKKGVCSHADDRFERLPATMPPGLEVARAVNCWTDTLLRGFMFLSFWWAPPPSCEKLAELGVVLVRIRASDLVRFMGAEITGKYHVGCDYREGDNLIYLL